VSDPAPDPADAFIEAAAAALGLPLTPEYRPGVRQNWETVTRMAKLVLEADMDEREEPAPVYRP
jgi:hypothetical protein